MKREKPFQFSIRHLLILTSAVAVVGAVAIRMNVPAVVQQLFTVYLVIFVGWAVLRLPHIGKSLLRVRNRSRELRERRLSLEVEVEQAKRSLAAAKAAESNTDPKP